MSLFSPEKRILACSSGVLANLCIGFLFHFLGSNLGYSQTTSSQYFTQPDTLHQFSFEVEAEQSDTLFHVGFFLNPRRVVVIQNGVPLADSLFFFDFPFGNLHLHSQYRGELSDSVSYSSLNFKIQIYAEAFQPPVKRGIYPALAKTDSALILDPSSQSLNSKEISQPTADLNSRENLQADNRNLNTVQQSGSITRGFTLGSNQDPYLNSALDLQLSGYLTEELRLQATLTDQNLPFQPEGATQTLNEFDRVHIALFSPNAQIEMGDVDLSLESGMFGVLKRRVQGAASSWAYGSDNRAISKAGLSVQRGTFQSLVLTPIEGVRGPYKLSGSNQEPFITIVSGSERVFLNGQLLDRGVNRDYIIDYGLAEITFTGDRFIATDDDIQVEYQYINREYSRTLFTASSSVESLIKGRTRLSATFIREADQNESLRSELLEQSGDIVPGTLVSGADSVGYSEETEYIRYTRIDTVISGVSEQIFRFIPGSNTNVWRVRFREVGQNEGHYIRSFEAENGLVYSWVGNGLGNFEPFVTLQAPKSHQLFTLHSNTKLRSDLFLETEWAISDVDLNRFSDLDDQDNVDQAFRLKISTSEIEWGGSNIQAKWTSQHTGARFEAFERIRDTEFNTFWGSTIDLRKSGVQEWVHQLDLSAEIRKTLGIHLLGESVTLGDYVGARAEGNIDLSIYGEVHVANSMIESTASDRRFERKIHEGNLQYPIRFSASKEFELSPTFSWTHEILDDRSILTGYQDPGSMDLLEFTPGFNFKARQLELGVSYGVRSIMRGLNGVLAKESESEILDFSMNWTPTDKSFSTRTTFGLLNQNITPEFQSGSTSLKRFRMKSINRYGDSEKRLSGLLNLTLFSEQKPLLQEVYVYTGPEIGSFIWEDLNKDNVQQIDEFFPELTDGEGVYSLQFIPSDEFEPVTDIQAQWQQTIRLIKGYGNREWDLDWISRISLDETSTLANPEQFVQFKSSVFQNPATTISGKFHVMEEITARDATQSGQHFSLRYERLEALQKRGIGIENRSEQSLFMSAQWRSKNRTLWTHETGYSQNKTQHDRLLSRNIEILTWRVSQSVQLTWNRSYQTTLRAVVESKRDLAPYQSSLQSNEAKPNALRSILRFEQRFFAFKKIEGQADIEWRVTSLRGSPSIYSEYELTGGTGQGSSWIWSLRSETKLNSTLRAALKWNGRTGFTGAFRQTVEVSVRALF